MRCGIVEQHDLLWLSSSYKFGSHSQPADLNEFTELHLVGRIANHKHRAVQGCAYKIRYLEQG